MFLIVRGGDHRRWIAPVTGHINPTHPAGECATLFIRHPAPACVAEVNPGLVNCSVIACPAAGAT